MRVTALHQVPDVIKQRSNGFMANLSAENALFIGTILWNNFGKLVPLQHEAEGLCSHWNNL